MQGLVLVIKFLFVKYHSIILMSNGEDRLLNLHFCKICYIIFTGIIKLCFVRAKIVNSLSISVLSDRQLSDSLNWEVGEEIVTLVGSSDG
jgi:hypothetical protein